MTSTHRPDSLPPTRRTFTDRELKDLRAKAAAIFRQVEARAAGAQAEFYARVLYGS